MPAQSIVFAALALFLPVPAAQTAQPAPTPAAAAAAKPDLSGQGTVVEKIASTIRFAKDGSSVRTLAVTEQILSDAGVRSEGILSISFASATDTVTFDSVRVRKLSGELVETPSDGAQEVPMPVTQQAPMCSDLRMKQLPVKSLNVGDTLEYQVTVKSTNLDSPGAFWHTASFTDSMPVKEETIELRVPRELNVLVKSKKVQPAVGDEGGERVYRWKHETASEYPKKQETDKTAAVDTVQQMYDPDIAISSFHSWAEVGAWYRGLIKDRAVPDAAIQAKADELTRGLTTDDAKVDALYNYVSTQYRYIAVSFGIGRLQPHTAAEVFRNQYGDCKDKHTLLQAMLAAEKIDAEPVLIGSGLRVNETLPMPSQFDHVITLVKLKDHDVWLDSTPEVAPSRMLMVGLRDKLALAIPATGDATLVKTEAALPFPSFVRETITGKLEKGGMLTAHFDVTMRGDAEVIYRAAYHQVPRAQWRELAQRISYNNGFAGDVSAVDASMPEKTAEPFHVSWDYTRKDFGEWENRRFPGMSTWFEGKIADDATAPKRAMRMDPTSETEVKVTLTLPDGYTVTVPSDVKHATAFAEYSSMYMLKDHALMMDRTMRYKVGELPVSEFGAYRDFLKGVSNDAGQMLQLVGASAEAPVRAENSEAAELLQQAYVDMQANDVKSARALLDKAKALNDHQLGLWAEYGDVELHGNKAEAVADYKKELGLHPENFVAYQKLATVYMTEGQLSDAEQILQSWKKADPSDPRPHSELGDLMFSEERYKDAVAHFQDALSLSTEPTMLKLSLGRAQLKAGQTDTGEATLHALMQSSSEARVLNGAAYELADAGFDLPADEIASSTAVDQIEELAATATVAEANPQNLSKALQTVVELAANWDTLGWIAYKRNQLPEAESYAGSAWELMPNIEVGLHLGQIYEAEGKKPDALTTYRLAVKSMPQKPQPRELRMEKDVEARAAALEVAGIVEKQSPRKLQGGNELAASHTYTISSPLKGQSASAEFLLLMGDNSAEDVRFVKGDETLKRSAPSLLAAAYRTPLPASSQAKVLRRGVLTCTTGSKTCQLVLLPAAEAGAD